jgi:hypothetical protein
MRVEDEPDFKVGFVDVSTIAVRNRSEESGAHQAV